MRKSALGHKRTLGHLQAMSALPPKADIGTQPRDVCFVPKADILRCGKERRYSITSSAMATRPGGKVRPSAFAVLRLITNSNLFGCTTGRSAGLAPLRILRSSSSLRLREIRERSRPQVLHVALPVRLAVVAPDRKKSRGQARRPFVERWLRMQYRCRLQC